MTPDTPTADVAQARRDRRQPPATPQGSGALTRAEYRRLQAAAAAEAPSGGLDEFEVAAQLFAFTGDERRRAADVGADDAEVQSAASVDAVDRVNAPDAAAHRVPRRARMDAFAIAKRVAAASFSIGVMTVVGMLAIGTTTPVSALTAGSDEVTDLTVASAEEASTSEIQAFVSSGETSAASLDRDESYDVASMADVAADSGVTLFSGAWVNDPSSNIQWPFPVGVPISAAYGSSTYLAEFSTPHRGVDLTPGEGAEVHVVAAGTVRIATEAGGDYGVTVVVDHIIDGQLVSTRYAHMQYGSLTVAEGDTVTAGQVIGQVGQTGKATGPHLHLEVLLNGTTHTDPITWLEEYTDGTHTVG
ncbi:MAG: M23 family metallopeptidase [Microbacterium sp.]